MSVEKICFGCADRDRVIEELNVREMLLRKRIAEIEAPPPTYTSASAVLQPLDGVLPIGE